ncbi:MAG: hypothetical protein RI100_00570 [Nitrosarchaeum sp.]|jgi:hypothetical protein|uniref:hypothetical protein n=1 Tax=Nitrosarchaeum sp. TaxID=2026886 RepID=UPI002DF36C3C|nr:hypothetical protein [Nitrosarchaeum sp.]
MTKESLTELEYSLKNVKSSLINLKKYPRHSHYKNNLQKTLIELKKKNLNFQAVIKNSNISKKIMKNFDSQISILLDENNTDVKLNTLKNLEMFWPEIENEFETIKQNNDFQISEIIPNNEHKKDLLEAIDCYNTNSYLACLVMCRRSFEGALVSCYKKITKTEPIRDNICPKCQKKIGTLYMGITSLHKWALKEELYPDKYKSLGILIADLGAGGAHPSLLSEFPRDSDIARSQIQNTAILLKLIYSKTKIL